MVEQRWLRTVHYPACVIDELTESFFAAPLLSIDETVLRAFPIDPFDVARTRRRPVVTATQAAALLAESDASANGDLSVTQMRARAELLKELAPLVRTTYTPIAPAARELSAPAVYAPLEPAFDVTAESALLAPTAFVALAAPRPDGIAVEHSAPVEPTEVERAPVPRPSTPVLMITSPRARGWVTGALLALSGLFVGGAFVCAALMRTEARIESMPAASAAVAPR